jgi:hypothetical protein
MIDDSVLIILVSQDDVTHISLVQLCFLRLGVSHVQDGENFVVCFYHSAFFTQTANETSCMILIQRKEVQTIAIQMLYIRVQGWMGSTVMDQ